MRAEPEVGATGTAVGVPPAAARLAPYLVAAPWAAALAALAATFVNPAAVQTYALAPLLLGTVFLGLPHGALDHLVPARLGLPWGRRPLPLGGYLAVYLALTGLFLGLWFLAPQAAFSGFLLLTVAHWGHGEVRFFGAVRAARAWQAGRPRSSAGRCLSPCRCCRFRRRRRASTTTPPWDSG